MDESEYLKKRMDDQINWFDKKSQYHQSWYKGLRIVEIISAASIPFLAGYIKDAEPHFHTPVSGTSINK